MRYGSVCSGVEAASLAWGKLGWKPVFFSEIEPFPCAVLKERFPDVVNFGDMTKIEVTEDGTITNGICRAGESIDLLVGGTPCQDVSVAGKRKGLVEGERSSLAFNYARLAFSAHARWICWENVPGVLSAGKGEDFAAFISSLAGWDVRVPAGGWKNAGIITNDRGGYGLAYRVLDAQYTRVPGYPRAIPQRRRRVFLVGYRSQPFGDIMDWTHSASVLFDGESLHRNNPPRRKEEQNTSGNSAQGVDGTGEGDGNDDDCGRCGKNNYRRECDGTSGTDCQGNGILKCDGNDGIRIERASRPYDASGVNPTLNQSSQDGAGIGYSNQELFSQDANGLVMQKVWTMDADRSNAMKSGNPNSGFHKADVAKTLDTTIPTPQKAQGGQMVLSVRTGHTCANGNGIQENATHTIGANDKDAIYVDKTHPYKIRKTSNLQDVMPTITASEAKGVQNEKDNGGGYILENKYNCQHREWSGSRSCESAEGGLEDAGLHARGSEDSDTEKQGVDIFNFRLTGGAVRTVGTSGSPEHNALIMEKTDDKTDLLHRPDDFNR